MSAFLPDALFAFKVSVETMHIILNSPLAPFWHFFVEVTRTVLFNCGLLLLSAFPWFLKCGHSRGPRPHLSCQELGWCSWQGVLLTFEYYVSEGKGCVPVTHFMLETLLAVADITSAAHRPSSVACGGTPIAKPLEMRTLSLSLPGEGSPASCLHLLGPHCSHPLFLCFPLAPLPRLLHNHCLPLLPKNEVVVWVLSPATWRTVPEECLDLLFSHCYFHMAQPWRG